MKNKYNSYHDLPTRQRARAIIGIDQVVRDILKLPTSIHWVDRNLIECIINKLDPEFDDRGSVISFSRHHTKIHPKKLKNIYDQCEKQSTGKINDVKKLLQLDRYRNPEFD
jgi:hypothetical protein